MVTDSFLHSDLIRKVSDTCGLVEVKNDTSISRKRFRRVVSGQDSYPGEWPWQASIEIKKKGTSNGISNDNNQSTIEASLPCSSICWFVMS